MVAAALEALVGGEPGDEAVETVLATIPAAELPGALRLLVREHGATALPVLGRCLAGRPEWATAAAEALGTLPVPAAAELLAATEATALSKPVRTAVRRALYRLRQAGITPPPPPAAPRAAPAPPRPSQAWVSAVDGTGARGLWLVVEGPLGGRTLLSVVLSYTIGLLDFAAGPVAKKRLAAEIDDLTARSTLPLVPVPPAWALTLLREARARHNASGTPVPSGFAEWDRWLATLPPAEPPSSPPIYSQIPTATAAAEPTLVERSAALLGLPELATWFLDPPSVQTEALELLQTRESRLVVSDQIKTERVAALIDRVIDAQFSDEVRRRWQSRLEETAFVLLRTGRETEARAAVATAQALADHARPARHVPFVRALVERSLEVAGEVALGRLSADEASRAPRVPRDTASR